MSESLGNNNQEMFDPNQIDPAMQREMNEHLAGTDLANFQGEVAPEEPAEQAAAQGDGQEAAAQPVSETSQQTPDVSLLSRGATRFANFMDGRRTTRDYTADKLSSAKEKTADARIVARGIGLTALDGATGIKDDFMSNSRELIASTKEDVRNFRQDRAIKATARKEARVTARTERNAAKAEGKMLDEAYKMNGTFDRKKEQGEKLQAKWDKQAAERKAYLEKRDARANEKMLNEAHGMNDKFDRSKEKAESKMLDEAYKMNDKVDRTQKKAENAVVRKERNERHKAIAKVAAKQIGKGALISVGIVPAAIAYGGYKVGEAGVKTAAKVGRAGYEKARDGYAATQDKVDDAKGVARTAVDVQRLKRADRLSAKAAKITNNVSKG